MKTTDAVLFLGVCLMGSGCLGPGGGGSGGGSDAAGWNNFMNSMFSTAPGAVQRKQDIIRASEEQRNAYIRSGGRWTYEDENMRIQQLNQDLQRNANQTGMDLINAMQNNNQ